MKQAQEAPDIPGKCSLLVGHFSSAAGRLGGAHPAVLFDHLYLLKLRVHHAAGFLVNVAPSSLADG
jgi:hypothetical protein